MISPDTLLQNRYRIVRPLGRGGMGAVYEALDLRLRRTVALKETLVETDELRRAFEREAHLLANLRHPALPKVLDHFEEAGGLFLVMEYIAGDDLGRLLEEEGRRFEVAEVLRWADQLLDALYYLHGHKPPVLHRDIKPSNLKLVSPLQITLLDFGLAKGTAGQMTRTRSHSVLAYSPNYSPLEQMQGAGTDERSDLYALGATLYHLLTGTKPVDALSRATAAVNGQPDPLRPAQEIAPGVPASVSATLMRAMALNIENRPRSAAEMRDYLHDMQPKAARTVPIASADEITRISTAPAASSKTPSSSAAVSSSASSGARGVTSDERVRERGRQVIVHLPEETRVAQKRTGGGRKAILGIGLAALLAALSAALYLSFRSNEPRREQSNRPVAKSSPRPSPSAAPTVENVNREADVNSQPTVTRDEMNARAKLADKNIPYTEEAFTKVVGDGDTGTVELFLAAGMNPNAKDAAGRPALTSAARKGSDQISRKLLTKGADVNAADAAGATALMEAAQNDHEKTIKVLLENGADVNRRDNDGRSAMLRAAARGHSKIVRLLINSGARIDFKDKDGRDALTWAEINNHSDVVELLRKAGAR